MTQHRIVAIVGATGAQGGGLARAILANPGAGFVVRAITRNPTSPAARQLAASGAEVVAGDVGDLATLKEALQGAWGAFFVTNFWAHCCPTTEKSDARNMAAAARAADLHHVIWSTLEDTRALVPLHDCRMPTLLGHYKVPHFDGKGESDAYFRELGVPTTFLRTSFYWENLITAGLGPRVGPDGNLVLALPMGASALPGIAAEDIGRCAFGIFAGGESFLGQTVGIAGEHLTGAEMAASVGLALGHTTTYLAIEPDAYRAVGFPGAVEMGNMFQYKRDFEAEYCGARSVERSRELNPQLQTFDSWLAVNARRIPNSVVTY